MRRKRVIGLGVGIAAILAIFLALQLTKKGHQRTEEVVYISPDLVLSDEELVAKYSSEAENGMLFANQAIFSRLFWVRGDFEKAKPYLIRAAAQGDQEAARILVNPQVGLKQRQETLKAIGEIKER